MAYTNPLDELKRLRMQTEQEYLQAREFATSRAKEIKTSPPDIGALRRLESEAGDYSRQKDPIVEAFQQPKKERSPILDAFSTGVRTFSYITDRLISGATFGLSDVVGKAVESGISKISGKDIDINRGYQPSETVKAVGDVADIGGGLLTGGMLLKGIKPVAAPVLSKVATSITQFVKGIHPAVKAGAGIGAGATAFETTRGAIDPDYADRRDTFPSKFGAGLRVGTGQLLETAGAVAKWKEQDKLAKTLTSKGEAIREGFDEAEPVEFSWRAWFDPDFYAVNVARTVPMTAALIPAMFAGWKIGGGAGARLGLGPFARTVAASLGGATLSRPLESALEAGDTYDQMYQQEISKGKSEEEAHNIADRGAQEVFNKNLALVGMDAAQLAVAFAPYTRMGGRIGSMLANRMGQAGIAAGKLAFEAGSEAGEEALQYAFQQQAMGEEIDWSSPEAKEAMAIGGLFGGVLGGAGVVNDAVKARMAANLPPEQKTILSQSIENKLEQGMTEEEAVERAFDEFAETPEGKEAIRKITAEVANEIEEEVWKQVEALESFEMESAVEDKSPTAEEEIQPVSVEEPTAIESQEQVEIPEPVTLEEQVQPMATEEQVLPVVETETVAVPTPEVAADIAEPASQPEAVAETVSMPVEEKAVVEPAVEPVEEPVTEPSAPATEAVPVKKDRSKITATHLRKQAQAMQKTIDAKRNPAIAKQRPTARRANIAAGMAKEADTLEDIQTKVNIVAQAIEDGTIPESLAGITKKTQVETLRKLLKEKYPKMGATLGKYSAQDLLAATEGVKGSAQLRKNLKAKLDALGQDEHVIPIRTKAELQEIETLVRMAGDKLDNYTKRNIKDSMADFKRLLELGIDSQDKLDQAISDFKELTQDDGRPKEITKEQKIKAAERELIGTKIEGYFPTPKVVVERMLEEADIQPGMKVLEPSAGKGNIADAIKEAEPQADLDVIEINSRLRDILEAKGHNIVGYDFLEYNEAKYDRIVMNPPFEKGQDIDHVKHAYDLLKPGGRVVSIMSEGPFFRGDKKAAEFRDWLKENDGTSEKLPKGSFESSERPTGVATRLVVIDKPEVVAETEPKTTETTQEPTQDVDDVQSIKFKAQPGTPEADLEVLRRAIKQRRLGPITINKVELAPEALSRPEFQATSAIAEKLGLRVVAFKGKGARGIQSGRTIYLNASLKDPLDYVFWHEVGHTMEVTHPEHYDRLMGIALDHIQDVHKLQSHYKAQDYALENMPHEFAADVFAESLTTPGFFERLKNEAPELIKPLLEAIEQLIARIKQVISKDDSVLPYLRDVEALQERIRKEVVEPYFKDAIGEKQFVEMFGHKWQEPATKTKAETRIDPTETPEFKRWFGDSVVTDNVANPLEVYHGTGAEFSVFDMSRGGERWEGDGKIAEMISKMGAFFTGNKEAAMEWANINLRSGEEPKVISAYLSIQNPKEYRSEYISPQDRLDILAKIKKRFDNRELPQEFDFDDYAYGFKDKKIPDSLDMLTVDILQSGGPENLKQQLIEEGYDGIIIHSSRDGDFGTQYVVFSPTQIKSVHNQGTWDPTNPDIRYKPERSKKPVKETKFNLQNPEVQERMEAAAGIPQKTTRDKLTEVFEAFKRKISREYEWLPRTGEFAELRQALLNLGKQKSVSADKTIRGLKEIVEPMNEYEYSLFTYKVIFDDLAHEAAEGRLLPFGLTPEILEIEKAAVDRDVEQNAKVKEAIRKRKQIWDRIKREYIQANEAIGHKVDEKLKKDDYYRHQVLEYANAKGITGTGRKLRTPSYRGYLRKRKGSTFDINTDYLQAEFEVMAQMHYDTMIARTIQVVKQHYDIVPQLKAQAIALNNENIMPIFEQMAESNVTAQKLYRMTLNKKQAIALDQLEKMAAKGELPDTPNGKYADVIEYLSARYLERELKKDSAIDTDISFERVMSEDEYNKRLFEYLGWLTKQPTSKAKIAALTYFKGRKEKERFVKDRLGDAYVTWQDLIPEGYVEWQPREGSVFYMASSIPEHVAEALYSEALESVGVTGDMLKKVLAKGQKFPAMVVKEEVALTLDNLVTSINKDNPFVQVLRAWKQWQLISPKRFLKYNIRNFTGDLDALIAGNPRAILKVPQAWAELRKAFFSKGHEMSPMLEEWFKRGGFETLFQAQEIYDINRNRQFRHLMEFKLKRTPVENLINAPKNAWYKYWDFARKATDFREALLRYACFLDYAEQVQNSPDGNPLNYGASNREEIKGLKDPLDRAFKLANELLGAYDEVSVVGVWLSDHLLPFWRWEEVNFVRYIRIFKNAYQDGKLLAAVGRRVAGMPIRSVVVAMHIGWFVLRLCALSAMITAWNMLFFRDEEDDLSEDVKSRFHIIFGRDDQGNILYFSRLGALQDFLDWFGLDSAHIHIQNLLSGKRNVQEVVTEMAKAPLVKIGTALGPHVTMPVGLFLKQQLYPDPLEPRRVRDEWEFIFDSFGLKDEYRELTGKPTMGYGRSLYNVVAYKSDPLQAAYYSIKDEKIRFMKKLNKQSYNYAVVESPKSDALYNFKLALRYKDAEAAKKYLLEYFYAGGTTRGLKQSLKSLHPLHGLKDAEKKAFILQLDSEGREDLVKALEYYHSILNPE